MEARDLVGCGFVDGACKCRICSNLTYDTARCAQHLTAKSMMRAPLARGAMSKIVAKVLRKKAEQEKKTCWNSTIEFIEATDTWFTHAGSGYAAPYTSATDPRLEEMRKACEWFENWFEDISAIPLGASFTKQGKEKMFMSRQTFWALRQTTYAFIGMCKHYLPKAPEGCGIRASRCSQDPVERFFVRTKVLRPSASIDTTHDATAFAISDGVL